MPTSVGSSIIGMGLILAILGFAVAAILVGMLAIIWEAYLFFRSGLVE